MAFLLLSGICLGRMLHHKSKFIYTHFRKVGSVVLISVKHILHLWIVKPTKHASGHARYLGKIQKGGGIMSDLENAFGDLASAVSSGLQEAELRRIEKYIAAEDCRGILMHLWAKGQLSVGWKWYPKGVLSRAGAVLKKHNVPFPTKDELALLGTREFSLKRVIDLL